MCCCVCEMLKLFIAVTMVMWLKRKQIRLYGDGFPKPQTGLEFRVKPWTLYLLNPS